MASFSIPFIVLSQEIVVEETNVTPSQVTEVIIVAALAEWPTATNTSPINEGFRMSLGKNPENMSELSRKRMAFLSALADTWRSFIVSPGTTRPALTGYADAFLPGINGGAIIDHEAARERRFVAARCIDGHACTGGRKPPPETYGGGSAVIRSPVSLKVDKRHLVGNRRAKFVGR
jgi:hypothetical protein